ncbi:MAG: DHH family phosphoesterase [Candidatus Nanohaloarchaea archaeon]|nr:DHH family phosphoesterase [Candidatus Nanohaloarchaea archaeon]
MAMHEEAIDFVEGIDQDDTVLIVHHWDMDGSAAAAIMSRTLEEIRGAGADEVMIPEDRKHQVGPGVERAVREENVSTLFVLDMSVPAARVAELAEEYDLDILIIDHHDFDRVPEDAVFINPRVDDDEAYIPAAKLCNDVAGEFGLDLDWIAGMGIIQDFAVEQCMEVFQRLQQIYPNYFPSTLSQHRLAKKSRYGHYSTVLNIKPYRDTEHCAELAFEVLTEANGLKYLESHEAYRELKEYYEEMNDEFERVKERYEEEREVYEDVKLVFFEFESPFHINSSVATQISLEQEDWVYVIAK